MKYLFVSETQIDQRTDAYEMFGYVEYYIYYSTYATK